jgi:outer membrane protein OmpA-like peptidoglycan-associated protein
MIFTARWIVAASSASTSKSAQSVVKIIAPPKISRDSTYFICSAGASVLTQDGKIEEGTKLTPRKYLLIQDGKAVDSIESSNPSVKFEYDNSYLNSSMSCSIQVADNSYLSTITTLSEKLIADATQIKKNEIGQADKSYSAARIEIYATRDRDLARIDEIKAKEINSAKTTEAISRATAKYRKALANIAKNWDSELQRAKEVRDSARDFADAKYRITLEKAGVSIFPLVVKSPVAPTPTATPSPTTSANSQVTPKMEIVGTVYMASGSYFLNDATKRSLSAIAKKIKASGAKNVLVYGHADSQGGVDNTALSRNRAKAVAAYIRPLLGAQKISIGWGSSKKPASTGSTATDLALNRRVEIYTDESAIS